jgi:hypothetical protein
MAKCRVYLTGLERDLGVDEVVEPPDLSELGYQ